MTQFLDLPIEIIDQIIEELPRPHRIKLLLRVRKAFSINLRRLTGGENNCNLKLALYRYINNDNANVSPRVKRRTPSRDKP